MGPVPVDTVFVGGGTPSLLGGGRLADVLDAVRAHFCLSAGAEVTTEANPESTSPELFDALRSAGYTRVSLGMQSSSPRVLAVLDRTHSPGRAVAAAREALAAGFDHVNLDLIYGTPGESDDDLLASLQTAVDSGADHISAYALVVEDGTALARRVRRGEIAAPDDDVLARRYQLVDQTLAAAGLHGTRCPTGAVRAGSAGTTRATGTAGSGGGPDPAHTASSVMCAGGMSSTRGLMRNLADGRAAAAGFERLEPADRHIEEVLLGIRLRRGLQAVVLTESERSRAQRAVDDELLAQEGDRLVLTDRGRLLADAVVRELLD